MLKALPLMSLIVVGPFLPATYANNVCDKGSFILQQEAQEESNDADEIVIKEREEADPSSLSQAMATYRAKEKIMTAKLGHPDQALAEVRAACKPGDLITAPKVFSKDVCDFSQTIAPNADDTVDCVFK